MKFNLDALRDEGFYVEQKDAVIEIHFDGPTDPSYWHKLGQHLSELGLTEEQTSRLTEQLYAPIEDFVIVEAMRGQYKGNRPRKVVK